MIRSRSRIRWIEWIVSAVALTAIIGGALVAGGTGTAGASSDPGATAPPATEITGSLAPTAPAKSEIAGVLGETRAGHAPPAPEIKGPLGSEPTLLDESCPDNNACFWRQDWFQGAKVVSGNQYAGAWYWVDAQHQTYRSIKNKFSNRSVLSADPNQPYQCTWAGTNRHAALGFTVVYIGAAGSGC